MAKVERDTVCMVIGCFWLFVAVGAQIAGDEVMMAAALVASQVWIVASWRLNQQPRRGL